MLVDCVTYVVCSSVGLDVGGESIPYIAGWGEDGALDAIREYAETIDTIARRIEDALDRRLRPRDADAVRAGGLTGRRARPRRSGLLAAPMIGRAGRLTTAHAHAVVAGRRPARPWTGRKQPPTERSPP